MLHNGRFKEIDPDNHFTGSVFTYPADMAICRFLVGLNQKIMKQTVLILLLLLLLQPPSQRLIAQEAEHSFSILYYNVENLFHPSDDPFTADEEFTPEGARRWNFYRYNKKITGLCKVFLSSNGWDPPTVICLSEIENRETLEDLTGHPLMKNFSYSILHRDSPDHRGIDVAMLYRREVVTCIETGWIAPYNGRGEIVRTREMLWAKFVTGKDTLFCVANHWTSKYGGAAETEAKRINQAVILGETIDSALKAQPGLAVIAGGDLNDISSSRPVKKLLSEYNLTEVRPEKGDHSYKYQGRWQSIDHIFIGGSLVLKKCVVEVISLPFLLEEDQKYTGKMPFRTYRGIAYNGGISDHLPLLLRFDPTIRSADSPP